MVNRIYDIDSGFHNYKESYDVISGYITHREDVEFRYTFENFFHPYVGELIEQLNRKSLTGMLDAKFHAGLAKDFFETYYTPLPETQQVSFAPFPQKNIDVSDGGPYSIYNWELLFHVPLSIAVHLSKNQRFAEAQRWFHYIFDPTSTDQSVPAPQRYWKFLRFRQQTDVQQVDELLLLLSTPDNELTYEEKDDKLKVMEGYQAILDNPFQPHRVARTRVIAYQYSVCMKYLDNLCAWGDSLFMQDTVESINEATMRYVLAANILGPRPQRIPARGTVRPRTFHELKAAGLDPTGNALVDLEGKFPFNLTLPSANDQPTADDQGGPLFGIGRTLYFCIPRNEKLLGYWDLVDDRLTKIRHCMNIQGVVRKLALFDPPIDPGMMVKAAAAGIDLGSVVAGLNQPLGPIRFQLLLQKAIELCGEVRGMGNALLSAIEKQDGEKLALLRQQHEVSIQRLTQETRFLQWKQSQESTQLLIRSRAGAIERYDFYQRLLGLSRDTATAPDTFTLAGQLPMTEANFDSVYASLVTKYDKTVTPKEYAKLKLALNESPSAQSGATSTGPLYLLQNENSDLNEHSPAARDIRESSMSADLVAAFLALIPDFGIDLHFWGLGGHANIFGGSTLATSARFYSGIKNMDAAETEAKGGNATKAASFERRADDWVLQNNLAAYELTQNGRQLVGALIAEQVAHREYLNVQEQITMSGEIDTFLRQKTTNEDLYGWMQGELSRLYYEYYRFAIDVARKAERAMKHDLMRPEVNATEYIKFNYWDGGRKGLLSGDALFLDLKRMELAYHESNRREFEMTRHISLRQLDPMALLALKITGSCEISIPEWLFTRDAASHYHRRIRNVALSIPSVVGPYTSLNATLSLLRSSIRTSPLPGENGFARTGSEDARFIDHFGSVEQVVTSSGLNDSGLHEVSLKDDRPLPFEGAGLISTWRIDLPKKYRAFDYSSISDVVLHVRYTSRQGGDLLGEAALEALDETLADAATSGLTLFFSLRHDFPSAWSSFVNSADPLTLNLSRDVFPYLVVGKDVMLDRIELASKKGDTLVRRTVLGAAADQAALGSIADALNDPDVAIATLTVPSDTDVLVRNSGTQAYLVVRYHLDI